jgi:hypothetical protein
MAGGEGFARHPCDTMMLGEHPQVPLFLLPRASLAGNPNMKKNVMNCPIAEKCCLVDFGMKKK